MNSTKIKSYAKINLALNITGKLKRLHKIESIVSFIDLYDLIFIRKINSFKHQISFYGKFSKNINSRNTISKLLSILDKYKLLNNQKFQIKVKKNIPQQAGLGGGSMNSANILNYLEKNNFIKIDQRQKVKISNHVGSDVILGFHTKSSIITSKGNIKKFSNCPKFYTLLVKPKFGCSTKKIYSKVRYFSKPEFNFISKNLFYLNSLKKRKNDLELIAIKNYPKLRILKNFLDNFSNNEFVRMTGSGSAMIAYFNSAQRCEYAYKKVKKKFRKYWCVISKTI